MNADFDDYAPRVDYSRGGARANSGPKKGHRSATQATPDDELTDYQRKERASADKEYHLSRQAAVKADIDEGRVVDRQAVVDAAARAFSKCSQALDAIGDILERDGFEPLLCEKVMELINAAKSKLAADLEESHRLARSGDAEFDDVLNGSTPSTTQSNDDFFA